MPLLKDFPLAQDLNADIAGRYTDYSISGTAETWKIGLNDKINDTIRLRGMVEDYGGRPEIAISSPAQIEFIQ